MHPSVGPAVPRGTDGLSSRRGADGAGVGLFARGRAGGRFGFPALVPLMVAFIRADLAKEEYSFQWLFFHRTASRPTCAGVWLVDLFRRFQRCPLPLAPQTQDKW